jgi:hypothetical protein
MIAARWARTGWAALVLTLAGCSSLDCTTAGCVSGVGISLKGFPAAGTGAFHTRACVDQACVERDEASLSDVVMVDLANGQAPGSVVVRLTVTRAGAPLVDSSLDVTLGKTMPNGPDCGPICSYAAVTATPAGLVQAPLARPGSAETGSLQSMRPSQSMR